ncbi:succinate-semialdehyde dehydrogenase I [Atlantibacter hermannii]|nr:succinate-semialdehyde dehydrogenase I [Atlantibacter hermannii]
MRVCTVSTGEESGIPDGVLNAVAGNTSEISDAIMESHEVRKISFTGSTAVGKTLVRNAAETMKKVSMELGGNAPYIVFDDADIDAAVKGALANKFRNAGQVCVSVNRFFIQDGVYDRFVNQLAEAVKQLKVGNGLEEGVVVGPLIEKAVWIRFVNTLTMRSQKARKCWRGVKRTISAAISGSRRCWLTSRMI